jgi:hypothetical protein
LKEGRVPHPALGSVQAYVDAKRCGSLRDAIGCSLWELPASTADELRFLLEHVGPITSVAVA